MSTYPTPESQRPEPAQVTVHPQSLPDMLKSLVQEIRTLIQQSIELGKTELKEESSQMRQVVVLYSGGAVLGQLGLLFLGLTLMFIWSVYLPLWLATLLVGFLFLAVAGVLVQSGRRAYRKAHPKHEK